MDERRILSKDAEEFYISPEDLQALDKAIREIDNGYELQTWDFSAWGIKDSRSEKNNDGT